jgi:signal transduction histidine kinase
MVSFGNLNPKKIYCHCLAPFPQAEEFMEDRLEIMSLITHELRTPINSTKGFLEMVLKDDSIPDDSRDLIVKALNSTRRMQTMVNDLLDLSLLMGSGNFFTKPRWFFLGDLVDSIKEDCSHMIPGPEVQFRLDLPENLNRLKVRSDPGRIRQVILNLIDNAKKHTMRGYVELSCRKEDETLTLMVKDTGMGIMPEKVDSIFEPFYQGSRGTARSAKGAGIGLTLSKEIIERLDGHIEVESELDRGSIFTIRIPIESTELDMVDNLVMDLR